MQSLTDQARQNCACKAGVFRDEPSNQVQFVIAEMAITVTFQEVSGNSVSLTGRVC